MDECWMRRAGGLEGWRVGGLEGVGMEWTFGVGGGFLV